MICEWCNGTGKEKPWELDSVYCSICKGEGTVKQMGEINLFQSGDFALHSGNKSSFKIECDSLTFDDWVTLAKMASEILPPFREVIGIPNGGIVFANCLKKYVTKGKVLIVDDVLTTGNSMLELRHILTKDRSLTSDDFIGVVAFARGKCPDWIMPLFQLNLGKN